MRTYKRKSEKGKTSPDVMLRAAREVKQNHRSIRSVAREFLIPDRTLTRFCSKVTQEEIDGRDPTPTTVVGYIKARKVFTDAQELLLEQYLMRGPDIYFGLCPKEVRKLAWEYAARLN